MGLCGRRRGVATVSRWHADFAHAGRTLRSRRCKRRGHRALRYFWNRRSEACVSRNSSGKGHRSRLEGSARHGGRHRHGGLQKKRLQTVARRQRALRHFPMHRPTSGRFRQPRHSDVFRRPVPQTAGHRSFHRHARTSVEASDVEHGAKNHHRLRDAHEQRP